MARMKRQDLMALDPETRAKLLAHQVNLPHIGKPRRQKKRAFAPGEEPPKRPTRKEASEKRERKAAARAMQWAHLPDAPSWRTLELPWPPSVNHYWQRSKHGNLFVSKAGEQFRAAVVKLAATMKPMEGRLRLCIEVHPPDKIKRDLDNIEKATLDALTAAHVYLDDSQIDVKMSFRRDIVKGGKLVVFVGVLATEGGAA